MSLLGEKEKRVMIVIVAVITTTACASVPIETLAVDIEVGS
jgi:hypothetical protein